MQVFENFAFHKDKLGELESLCRQYQVESLYIFGSALTHKFQPDSDVDLLVTFKDVIPENYADNYFDFRDALSKLFQRKIDLVESQTLKNPYFKHIVDTTKMQIYGRGQGIKVAI
jgi:predicted nucleotidyltransferase